MRRLVAAGLLLLLLVPPAQATIVIRNNDGPGEGFNDPTPAVPIGGNPGTTVGEQRLIAFDFAATIWDQILQIPIQVEVLASFDSLPCTATSGVLGSAGPGMVALNFVGAPRLNTWYVVALANQLAGVDLFPSEPDIVAAFQSDLGQPDCLATARWYYGLDNQAGPGEIDLVITLLHEFAHGLGFLSLVDEETGARFAGQIDIYSTFLFDRTANESWETMSDAERAASATNSSQLVWTGSRVTSAAAALSAGRDPEGRLRVYAPDPVRPGSSISHWTTGASPNLLMEPFASPDVPQQPGISKELFEDIGWLRRDSTPVVGVTDVHWRRHGDAVQVDLSPWGVSRVALHRVETDGSRPRVAEVEVGGEGSVQLRDPLAPPTATDYWLRLTTPNHGRWEGPYPVAARTDRSGPDLRVLGPNPTGTVVSLGAFLPKAGVAQVEVFDLRGRSVRILHRGTLPAGWAPLQWDGTDPTGARVPRGVYLVELRTATRRVTTRVAFLP